MNAIVAVDKNWAIGFENKLLVRIPADMKMFKNETINKVVIMGRNTLESFPASKPLINRVNIVITRNKNYKVKDAVVVNSLEEAMEEAGKYNTEDVYVIGGASIYKQLLEKCDVVHVTKIDYEYQADTYFPNLDEMPEWQIEAESVEQTYYDLEYRWLKYVKR